MTSVVVSSRDEPQPLAVAVGAVLQFMRTHERSVPQAVAELWPSLPLEETALAELARTGLCAAVQRALAEERFIVPRRQSDVTTRVVASTPRSRPRDKQTVRVTMYQRVQYAGRDFITRPLIKFILTDVEAVIERLDGDIAGKTRVRDWFGLMRSTLQQHGTDRVADLPVDVLAELAGQSPFATD